MSDKIVVICGPTASGKTALSIALAKAFDGEVVSADSMQIYRGMDIGTAKPTREEMAGIPHHMLDVAAPGESYSVSRYVAEATACVEDIPFVLSDLAGHIQSHRGADNELLDELLKSVACKAAVKAGMVTDTAELQKFAETVLADNTVRNCPHGRPCVTYVSRYQLEKLFKRIL